MRREISQDPEYLKGIIVRSKGGTLVDGNELVITDGDSKGDSDSESVDVDGGEELHGWSGDTSR